MFKNINNTAKPNQYLWDNLGTVLPRTPEKIVGIPRIYQTVANIKFPLTIHQGKYVYIWHWPHLKWILFCSYGHEDHIMPKTSKR